MTNQKNDKSHALTGADNKRLDKTISSDNQASAAWMQSVKNVPQSHAAIINNAAENTGSASNKDDLDTRAVLNAKEWVDNGSRL